MDIVFFSFSSLFCLLQILWHDEPAAEPVSNLHSQRRGRFRFARGDKGVLWRLLEVFEPIEKEIRVGRHVVQQVDVTGRDRQLEPVSQALLFRPWNGPKSLGFSVSRDATGI